MSPVSFKPCNILRSWSSTQWVIGLLAICVTLVTYCRGIAQEFGSTELIAIRELVATKVSQRPDDQVDKKEADQFRRISAVVGLLIDLQKQSGEKDFEIAKFRPVEKTDSAEQDGDELQQFEARHLKLLTEVLTQKQSFLELHHTTSAHQVIGSGDANVAEKLETTDFKKVDWMQHWDRTRSKLIASELIAIKDRAKSLLKDTEDLEAKEVNAVLAIGRQFVDTRAEADVKNTFRTEGSASSTESSRTSPSAGSSSDELKKLLDHYTSLVKQVDETVDPRDESEKERLRDEFSTLHENVEAIRESFVLKRASSIARERLLIYGLLNSQTPEITGEPASIINDLRDLDLSVSAPLAALLTADEFLGEAIDAISTDKPQWIVSRFLNTAWNYELTFGEDVSVTLGEIILLIASLSSAIFLSFVCSRLIGKYIVPWFGISKGASIAWRLIIRNVLALLFTFVAFQLFGVPLTAFAFVGGAAALAVGFGSKDIANNFMSGLIILTEQPIRVNDVILYDSKQCLVTYIGLRSTRLRNLENHDLVVPNSVLIDRLVTNLTLMDKRIRLVLPVEVDRIEDVDRAISGMVRELRQLPSIHHEVSPAVFLKSVDTYYLNFEIHVTVEFNDLESINQIQSEVLRSISHLFPSVSDDQGSESQLSMADAVAVANEDVSTSSKAEGASDSTGQGEVNVHKRLHLSMKCSKEEIEQQIAILKQALKTK